MSPRSTPAALPRHRLRRALTALTLVGVTALSACTALRRIAHGPEQGPDPRAELRAGTTALEAGDFAAARERLTPLTTACLTSPLERRAALLRASAELDPTNPDGAPTTAASLAARVFVRAPTGEPDAAIARALYALALDRGASPPAESSDPQCEPPDGGGAGALPPVPGPSTADRLTALGDSLAAQSDSVAALRARAAAAEERARTLEQELERIRQLLRGGRDPRS